MRIVISPSGADQVTSHTTKLHLHDAWAAPQYSARTVRISDAQPRFQASMDKNESNDNGAGAIFKKSGLIFHAVTISDHDGGKKPKSLEI